MTGYPPQLTLALEKSNVLSIEQHLIALRLSAWMRRVIIDIAARHLQGGRGGDDAFCDEVSRLFKRAVCIDLSQKTSDRDTEHQPSLAAKPTACIQPLLALPYRKSELADKLYAVLSRL